MSSYFNRNHDGRQGNFVTMATALSREYKAAFNKTISTRTEYNVVQSLAQDRDQWKHIVSEVVNKYCEAQEAKRLRQTEARKARSMPVS